MSRGKGVGYYEELWEGMETLRGKVAAIDRGARRVLNGRKRYEAVERRTGVPWVVVGVIHLMEAGCDFAKGLFTGEPWNKKTRLIPKGRGPFKSWENCAVAALKYDGLAGRVKWIVGWIGKLLEKYNGGGYLKRGVHSPYLWSFCNWGIGTGKYVEDGRYDSEAVSGQAGAMVVLRRLAELGVWEAVCGAGRETVTRERARRLQRFLNAEMGAGEKKLVIDGLIGPKTREAIGVYLALMGLAGDRGGGPSDLHDRK